MRFCFFSRPILYSNWLSKDYVPVDQEQLREYTKARLKVKNHFVSPKNCRLEEKSWTFLWYLFTYTVANSVLSWVNALMLISLAFQVFYEEELDVPLVLFNEVLDNVLRIDRIFRQPQGHLLLIGVSGSGKTTLSRFVAWMNGLKVFQVKVVIIFWRTLPEYSDYAVFYYHIKWTICCRFIANTPEQILTRICGMYWDVLDARVNALPSSWTSLMYSTLHFWNEWTPSLQTVKSLVCLKVMSLQLWWHSAKKVPKGNLIVSLFDFDIPLRLVLSRSFCV